MGTKVTPNGVSIQFCRSDGSPDGEPLYSKWVVLRGRPQEEVTGNNPLSQEEIDHPGSEDWLTLIAVADSADKLEEILTATAVPHTTAHTSGSSRRVCVEMSMGGFRQSFDDRITIASGPIVDFKDPKMHVVHIKVLAGNTKMDDGHPLIEEFDGMAHVFTLANQARPPVKTSEKR